MCEGLFRCTVVLCAYRLASTSFFVPDHLFLAGLAADLSWYWSYPSHSVIRHGIDHDYT